MSHWLATEPRTTQAADAIALAAELRTEAAIFDIIRDLLERASRAVPDSRECEGWMGQTRTAFDERAAALAGATWAGSHHADLAAELCTRWAREADDRAATLAAAGAQS